MSHKTDNCPWEAIASLRDLVELNRFRLWMQGNIAGGLAEQVPAAARYRNIESLKEEWFLHIPSGTVWRLVYPEPPFAGLFEKVAK